MEKKKKRGCLIPILIVIALAAIFGSAGGGDKQDAAGSAADAAKDVKSGKDQTYSTEFNPEYNVSCADKKITIDVTADCPDGTILQCVLTSADAEHICTDTQETKSGKATFTLALESADTQIYSGVLLLQFNADTIKQPDAAKEAFGEYGEKLTGSTASAAKADGHPDAKNAMVSFTVNYPNDEAVQQQQDAAWNEYKNGVISASDGLITAIEHPEDHVFHVYCSNNWYLLPAEQKEYLANTLYDGITKAGNAYFGEGTVSLTIYAGEKAVAESSLFSGGMKMKK